MRFVFDLLASGTAGLLAPVSAAASLTAFLTRALRVFRDRRALAWGVGFPLFAIYAFALWHEVLPVVWFHVDYPETGRIIRSHKWISYAPDHLDVRYVPLDETRVRRELTAVRRAGFTGIITYSTREELAVIPSIASSVGLAVIAGIWDPTDRTEIESAIKVKESVAAYAVGHIGLHEGRYTYDDVLRAMRLVRFRTARPVSTTEKLDRYENDLRLLGIGDWIFPDAHFIGRTDTGYGDVQFDADIERDVTFILDSARLIADWDREDKRGREILLKTIGYPYDGIPGASAELQQRFFVTLLDSRRDSRSKLPARVSIAVHTAYDATWKTGWPYYPWDRYMALFDEQRRPRPAVKAVVERL